VANIVMSVVVGAFYVIKIHGLRDAELLIEIASVSGPIWVILNASKIAFEVAKITTAQ
jgi:hypothetical protein